MLQPIYKSTDQINADAESFLSAYHPSLSVPVPIEEIIDLQLGIDIIPIPDLKDFFVKTGLGIDAFIAQNFKSISVDRHIQKRVNTRYRFTLAHEIGHMVLHQYLYEKFVFRNADGWAATIYEMPLPERQVIEWQADEFAGLVLVPRKLLRDEFKKAIKSTGKKLKISFIDKPDFITDAAIEFFLAPLFGVSKYVIMIRLEKDGLK